MSLMLIECASSKKELTKAEKDAWGVYPNTTTLGQVREYAIRGENLFACEIIAGPSVTVKKKEIHPDGSTMKVEIQVKALLPNDPVDVPGTRVIQVRQGSVLKELELYVLGEKREPAGKSLADPSYHSFE